MAQRSGKPGGRVQSGVKMKTAGIYFSGTGNTRYCTETFVQAWDEKAPCGPLESPDAARLIRDHDRIVLGYPIYYSSLPVIVRDFILLNASVFQSKRLFLIATMGLFSGDGAGCAARLLKKQGAVIEGGLHVRMPDCIGDEKVLKKPLEENRKMVRLAGEKLCGAAAKCQKGKPPREGLGFPAHLAGLFGQRLWFYGKTRRYSDQVTIHEDKCIGCGVCVKVCPMDNLVLSGGKAVSKNRCTLCYRCFSICPKQAVTILGKTVHEQCRLEKYL